jgi:hypothetical protein
MTTAVRSPNYPALSLSDAIQRLQQLYRRVSRGEFTVNDAAGAWKYKSVSGPVKRQVAALRHYGLIDRKRGGNARVSCRGLTIVLRTPESGEYRNAIREAALIPSLFQELYTAQRHTAADDVLRQYLVVERNFGREGAEQFIGVFRATMTLAGLTETGIMSGQEEESESDGDTMLETLPTKDTMTIPIPFGPERIGRLIIPVGMTVEDWKRLDRILAAYKPDAKENGHSRQDAGAMPGDS